MGAGVGNPIVPVDVAQAHPAAFLFMSVLVLIFGAITVATESKVSVLKWTSFLHFWMAAYLVLLAVLMSVTTAIALGLLFDDRNHAKLPWLPASFAPISAAVVGVFAFEIFLRRFIIGFGENQLDVAVKLQQLVDQAVAATLKKEA